MERRRAAARAPPSSARQRRRPTGRARSWSSRMPARTGRRCRRPRPGWRIRWGRRPGCRCRAPPPCRRCAASTPAAANAARYDRDLRGPRRCRDVHGAAVLVGGGAAHHGQDPVAVPQRIRQPLEQHHGAALAARRTRPPRRRTRGSVRWATACPAADPATNFRGSSITRRRRPGQGRSRRRAGCGRPCARRAGQTNMRCPP